MQGRKDDGGIESKGTKVALAVPAVCYLILAWKVLSFLFIGIRHFVRSKILRLY